MKKNLLTLIIVLTAFAGRGQNLVPNGGFESFIICPNSLNQFAGYASNWINPTMASVDYFHQCSNPNFWVGVPDNILGFQQANNGSAYAGIVTKGDSSHFNYREYIEADLTSTLIANTCYHFEMYVNKPNKVRDATDALGVYFSDTLIAGINNDSVLFYTPQINNTTGFITDTINWILISGNYTAAGGENYLIIGNFNDDANTNIITDSTAYFSGGYVYIDDVSLTPCATGINIPDFENLEYLIYPNPAADNFELRISSRCFGIELNKKLELRIADMMGIPVETQYIASLQNQTINISHLSTGIYLIEINGVRKKFVKQ